MVLGSDSGGESQQDMFRKEKILIKKKGGENEIKMDGKNKKTKILI